MACPKKKQRKKKQTNKKKRKRPRKKKLFVVVIKLPDSNPMKSILGMPPSPFPLPPCRVLSGCPPLVLPITPLTTFTTQPTPTRPRSTSYVVVFFSPTSRRYFIILLQLPLFSVSVGMCPSYKNVLRKNGPYNS